MSEKVVCTPENYKIGLVDNDKNSKKLVASYMGIINPIIMSKDKYDEMVNRIIQLEKKNNDRIFKKQLKDGLTSDSNKKTHNK